MSEFISKTSKKLNRVIAVASRALWYPSGGAIQTILKLTVMSCVATPSNSVFGADYMESLSSSTLVSEVMTSVERPHAYDWRKADFIADISALHYMVNNSFESSGIQMSLGIPIGNALVRLGIRRVTVEGTLSSVKLSRTPFMQDSLQDRFEGFAHYALRILEGRSLSILSPYVSDPETVFFIGGGIQYSHPNAANYPKKSDVPETLPGQNPQNAAIGLEISLLWQLFLPNNLGMQLDYTYHIPLGHVGYLSAWAHFGIGATMVFGGE